MRHYSWHPLISLFIHIQNVRAFGYDTCELVKMIVQGRKTSILTTSLTIYNSFFGILGSPAPLEYLNYICYLHAEPSEMNNFAGYTLNPDHCYRLDQFDEAQALWNLSRKGCEEKVIIVTTPGNPNPIDWEAFWSITPTTQDRITQHAQHFSCNIRNIIDNLHCISWNTNRILFEICIDISLHWVICMTMIVHA